MEARAAKVLNALNRAWAWCLSLIRQLSHFASTIRQQPILLRRIWIVAASCLVGAYTLGVLWYVINPLVLLGAYTLMFGHVFKVQSYRDFPVFLMIGLVVWTFFQQSLLAAAESLIDQGALVRKARFPRETIPAAVVTVQLVTFLLVLTLLGIVMVAVRGTLDPALLALPVLLVALYAGIPAANDAHRIALETFREKGMTI